MATSSTSEMKSKNSKKLDLAVPQKLGRSLMLPIASLPAAGLLVRLGQDDMLGRFAAFKTPASVIEAAGNALLDNLPLLFAVGIAIGWAKKSDGSTALAALVGYLSLAGVFTAMSPVVLPDKLDSNGNPQLINYGVLGGIVIGLVSAKLWEKYHRTKLPDYLGFFSGRRLIPILSALAALAIGVIMALIYPAFNTGLTWIANKVADNAVVGGGIFGFINRMLLPVGLHHIVNSIVWFVIGEYPGANGEMVHGDIARFLSGDPTAGTFMTGFFPIMMFGLPAAALAILHEAKPKNKKTVGGIMVSVGLTSMLTGITEPLEFSFIFVAWPLLLLNAVLTASSLALTNWLGIHDGFTFSAGAIDYILNFTKATHPLWIIPIGLGYALIYYFSFRLVIRKWNLATPGREDEILEDEIA